MKSQGIITKLSEPLEQEFVTAQGAFLGGNIEKQPKICWLMGMSVTIPYMCLVSFPQHLQAHIGRLPEHGELKQVWAAAESCVLSLYSVAAKYS